MHKTVLEKFRTQLETHGLQCEKISVGNMEHEFYFPDSKLCLFIVDEEKYNENTVSKEFFESLITKFEEKDIELLLIYSSALLNKFDIIFNRLLYRLKSDSVEKINGRSCEVREIDYKQAKDFLEKYHFQGNVMSKVRVGLFHKDELVSLMVFSKPRYNTECEWEIGRYAVKFGCNVRGNFSIMINHFIKAHNPESVLTYHDNLFGNNSVYVKCGFKQVKKSPCGFFWYKEDKLHNRRGWWKGMLPQKLEKFNPSISAHNNMRENGFVKVWDLGQNKYYWSKNG